LVSASIETGVPVIQSLFSAGEMNKIPDSMRQVEVILLSYTLDHLPDPVGLLQALREVLEPERGILIIEVHDIDKIVQRLESCLFMHEHTIYANEATLVGLLNCAGLRFVTSTLLSEKERRGNSLLVVAAHPKSVHACDPQQRTGPRSSKQAWTKYKEFAGLVYNSHSNLRHYVQSRVAAGWTVAGYGAGGRGVMTLAMADLNGELMAYLGDQNPSFHGFYAPCSHVPIVSPDYLLKHPTDEVIVFSFGYLDEIRQQLSEYDRRGGRFVSLLELLK
jgi:hypothetical protein